MPNPVINRRFVSSASAVSGNPNDNFESYSDAVLVNGLANGENWNAVWVDATGPLGQQDYDDFESYVDGAALNGLNNRVSGFPTAWVDA